MTKTYQSIKFKELHRQVLVGENVVNVSFTGGLTYPRSINGTFTTTDKKLQKALESNKAFDKVYRLLYAKGEKVYEEEEVLTDKDVINALQAELKELKQEYAEYKEANTAVTKKPTSKKAVVVKKEVTNDSGAKQVEGIINAQQARDYLVKEFGIDKKKLPSPVSIRNAAKKNMIEFVDWAE